MTMKRKTGYSVFAVFVPSVAAAALLDVALWWIYRAPLYDWAKFLCAAGAAAISAFVVLALRAWLLYLPKKHYAFRRFSDSLAAVEGYWLEWHGSDRNRWVSVAQIQFDGQSGEYRYSGYAYTMEGSVCGQWETDALVDKSTKLGRKVTFTGRGIALDAGSAGLSSPASGPVSGTEEETKEIPGDMIGALDFQPVNYRKKRRVTMGIGWYFDSARTGEEGFPEKRSAFEMERLTPKLSKKLIGKKEPADMLDVKALVASYRSYHIGREEEIARKAGK